MPVTLTTLLAAVSAMPMSPSLNVPSLAGRLVDLRHDLGGGALASRADRLARPHVGHVARRGLVDGARHRAVVATRPVDLLGGPSQAARRHPDLAIAVVARAGAANHGNA